jgi:hypothetical protein
MTPPTYGTFDGKPAAAVNVGCTNGGGTADGYMAYADVIFAAHQDAAPAVIAIVRPHIRPWGSTQLASLLGVSFRGHDIVSHEVFYGGSDGTCCPSGRATSIWKISDGRLVRIRTTITREPHRL